MLSGAEASKSSRPYWRRWISQSSSHLSDGLWWLTSRESGGVSVPSELYDRDGELWWRDGDGDRWYLLGDYFLPRTLAEIDANYGPLTKVAA